MAARSYWDPLRDDVIRAVRQSTSYPELVNRLTALTGRPVTRPMIESIWLRWRRAHPQMPALPGLFGADLSTAPDPGLLVVTRPEVEVATSDFEFPAGTRAPEAPIDSNVADAGAIPRSLICDGDLHYPIHDPYVEAAKLAFARDVKPQVWVNIGDLYDCWLISMHAKESSRMFDPNARLQEEFDSAQPYLKAAAGMVDRYHLILGNHENRLNRLIGANLGLFRLRALEWEHMAGLPANVTVHPYATRLRVGAMTFEHGDRIGGKFGAMHPAHWLLEKRGNRNTIFGHTHRAEVKHRTVYDEAGEPHQYVAINQGHGSATAEQKYAPEANWQHGFTFVEFWTEAGKPRFTAHLIVMVNGCFSWGGKTYNGRRCQ